LKLQNKIKSGVSILVAAIFISLSFVPLSSANAENEQENIGALLTKLGIVALIEDIPVTIRKGLIQKQQEKGIEKKLYIEKVSKIVTENFSSKIILNSITARLTKTKLSAEFQKARYDSIQKLLNSQSALKLIALKEKSRSIEAVEEIKKIASQHDGNPLEKTRLQLIESFDNASAQTEFSIATQVLSIDAVLKISNATDAAGKHEKSKKKQDMISMTYELLLRPSKYSTMMTLRHTFKPVTDDELKGYILIYRQKQLQWMLQNIMVALSDTMQDVTEKVVREIN